MASAGSRLPTYLIGALAILAAGFAPFAYRDLATPAPTPQAVAAANLDRQLRSYFEDGPAPIWTTSTGASRSGQWLLATLEAAEREGLNPADYQTGILRQALRRAAESVQSRAQAERQLSQAYLRYVHDLRVPPDGAQITFVDPELRPQAQSAVELLENMSTDPQAAIRELEKVNPIYAEMRDGLADYRRRWSGLPRIKLSEQTRLAPGDQGPQVRALRRRLGLASANDRFDAELAEAVRAFREVHGLGSSSVVDGATIAALNAGPAQYERILTANLDRLRTLPVASEARYVLVDIAGAELRMMEGAREVGRMRVIVGRPAQGMKTPQMAALIRFAVANPYWNLPPDVVRNSIAPAVLAQGPQYLAAKNYEVLSGWTEDARTLAPEVVDWQAVANGRAGLRVRQRPGSSNVMGRIKFMFPNRFGIYLHDFPGKALFRQENRMLSHGCVRLDDAERLARWLLGPQSLPSRAETPERRISLPRPIPVYLLYLTATARDGVIEFRDDPYGLEGTAS